MMIPWVPKLEYVVDRSNEHVFNDGNKTGVYRIREAISKKVVLNCFPSSKRTEDIKKFEEILTNVLSLMNADYALTFDKAAQSWEMIGLNFTESKKNDKKK